MARVISIYRNPEKITERSDLLYNNSGIKQKLKFGIYLPIFICFLKLQFYHQSVSAEPLRGGPAAHLFNGTQRTNITLIWWKNEAQ